jgi:hypothetical protein
MRDDFTEAVKDSVASRVGFKCSNPDCRAPTAGPQTDSSKSLNLGVAAHITAASPGGPRYDPNLTPEQRRSLENAIWLCQTHAKLVDNDPCRFTADLLRCWKRFAEAEAERDAGRPQRPAVDTEAARKKRELEPWLGKRITHAFVRTGRSAELSGRISGRQELTLFDVTDSYVTIGTDRGHRSVPLSQIEISFDNAANRVEIQERTS